jgi:hypothetical protein
VLSVPKASLQSLSSLRLRCLYRSNNTTTAFTHLTSNTPSPYSPFLPPSPFIVPCPITHSRSHWTGIQRTMPQPKSEFISQVWRDGIFNDKVVFCTGGNGTICSQQVRALVHLGANACIVGRNVEKTEEMAKDLCTAREGSKVIGIGAVDVRNVINLQKAVDQCVKELGGIDFLMYIPPSLHPLVLSLLAHLADVKIQIWRSRQLPRPPLPTLA